MAQDNDNSCPGGKDLIKLGPDLGGVRPYARHTADHKIETGMLEGRPLTDGAVYLEETQDRGIYNVVHEYKAPGQKPAEPRSGPAMVASQQYKSGWDNIFGTKAVVGQA